MDDPACKYNNIGRSLGTDYFRIADQLTDAELDYWRRTRDFVDDEVLPGHQRLLGDAPSSRGR